MEREAGDINERGAESAEHKPAPRRKSWVRRLTYALLAAIVLYFVGGTLLANLRRLPAGEVHVNFALLAAAVPCFLVASLLTSLTMHFVVASFGVRPGLVKVGAAYWAASLGKYIPGKVASTTGVVALLVRLGVRLPVAIAVPFLTLAIGFLTGVAISAPLLLAGTALGHSGRVWVWLGVAVLAAAVFLHPRVLTTIANIFLRHMKREPIADRLKTGPMLLAALSVAVRGMTVGLGAWLIARSLTPVPFSAYPFIMASAVGATLLGLLAFFAPAGIGVREGMYMLLLGPLLGPDIATLVAVLARVVTIFVDVAVGSLGLYVLRAAGVFSGARAS